MTNYQPLPKTFNNITLTKDWFYKQTDFILTENLIHEDACLVNELMDEGKYDEDKCNCNPKINEVIVAKLLAALDPNKNKIEEEKHCYWQVTISEYLETFKSKEEYLIPELYPPILLERIENAMLTLYYYLKYYEKTNEEWDGISDMRNIIYD